MREWRAHRHGRPRVGYALHHTYHDLLRIHLSISNTCSDLTSASCAARCGSIRRLEDKLDRIAAALRDSNTSPEGGSKGGSGDEQLGLKHGSSGDIATTDSKTILDAGMRSRVTIAVPSKENSVAMNEKNAGPTSGSFNVQEVGKSEESDSEAHIEASLTVHKEEQHTLATMGRTLALVAKAVGVNEITDDGGAEERRRLKEKLKSAMESGTRHSVRHIESEREMWTEYIFGICKPDGRVGKAGSRHFPFSAHLTARHLMCQCMQW